MALFQSGCEVKRGGGSAGLVLYRRQERKTFAKAAKTKRGVVLLKSGGMRFVTPGVQGSCENETSEYDNRLLVESGKRRSESGMTKGGMPEAGEWGLGQRIGKRHARSKWFLVV